MAKRTRLVGRCISAAGAHLELRPGLAVEYCGSVSCWKKGCGLDMTLKRSDYVREKQLSTTAVADLNNPANKKQMQHTATDLIAVVAAILDAIGQGEVTHVTVGKPRNGMAFLVTVNYQDGYRQYIGGASLGDLVSELADQLLEAGGPELG